MGGDALVPEGLGDFRRVAFWDGFFATRAAKAFEWYGEWRQLRPLALALCRGRTILVPGCGNSSLSADMYDDGCEAITNIDFSKVVIKGMMTKHLRKRPKMKWMVMDMTETKFANSSFQVVVDKGSLDALMGEDTPEAEAAGTAFLTEVMRLLDDDEGVYLCVSLCQAHVLRKLLEWFSPGWAISLHVVPPTPDMAHSPLQPLLVVVQRAHVDRGPGCAPVRLCFMPPFTGPNAEQLTDVWKIADGNNKARAKGKTAPQEDVFAQLAPGRRVVVDLQGSKGAAGLANGRTGAITEVACRTGLEALSLPDGARFSATVLDAEGTIAEAAQRDCCIFIVPQGREHEWAFATEEGQRGVMEQFQARRVVFIRLNRGHKFSSVQAVSKEVNQQVQRLLPASVRGISSAVPIATLGEGIGWRTVREEINSPLSGPIIVEDVLLEDEVGGVRRRMMFASTSHLVQTEACIQPQPFAGARGQACRPELRRGARDTSTWVVDHKAPLQGYQLAMVLGSLTLGAPALEECQRQGRAPRAVVVGVGGGVLPMQLHRHCGAAVHAVELDSTVLDLARRHFGFTESATPPTLKAVVGDGLEVVASLAETEPASCDLLFVDANSGDASQAMTCPPSTFLAATFLENARRLLVSNGLLVVNCVSRQSSAVDKAIHALQAHFAATYTADLDEDVNCILFAAAEAENFGVELDGRQSATELLLARCPNAAAVAEGHSDASQGKLAAQSMLSRLWQWVRDVPQRQD